MANKTFVVQYLIKARDRFSRATTKVAQSTTVMTKKLHKASAATLKFSERMSKLGGKLKKVGAGMTAFVTAPAALLGFTFKNAARDAEETASKFAVVFGSVEEKANAVAANLAKNYGLASDESKELLSDTGDLLAGFGFTQDQALSMSEQVNKLAVDLASFKNVEGGAARASDALTKALLGEREMLKSMGIAILETDVKQKISQMLAEGHTFSSLRQAKAQATLALAMEQSKNAVGDFARTKQSLANQERVLASRFRDLKVVIGKLLLPVVLVLTKAAKSLVEWFMELSPTTQKVILVLVAIVAVLGPVILAIGTVITLLPILAAGFTAVGTAITFATWPVALIVAAIAAAAFLIWKYWDPIKKLFEEFGPILLLVTGPIGMLGVAFMSAAKFIREHWDPLVAFFENIIDLIVQAGEAVMKFYQNPAKAVWDFFTESDVQAMSKTQVDVGVNVGLDKGLKPTSPPAVVGNGVRRTDVGLATAG